MSRSSIALLGLASLLPLPASAAPDVDAAIASLETAFAAAPNPLILLAIADLEDQRPKSCDKTLAAYRRFFTVCTSCDALSHAVARFDEVLSRCSMDIGEEAAVREKLSIPRAQVPLRLPGDATRREVVDLMMEARKVDWSGAMRGLVAITEAGSNAPVALLNEQRVKAWEILQKLPATAPQILGVLDRVRQVDPEQHAALVKRLLAAEASSDQSALDTLRKEALAVEFTASTKSVPAVATTVGCVANPKREWGTVTIDTTPWSVIYVNGEKLGSTPLNGIQALAGCVTIRAVSPNGTRGDVVQNLTVRPNKTAVLRLDLAQGSSSLRYE
ncbi:MAG: hypothetical protein U1E65_16155 [Myxococcota bacterium]